MKCELCGDKLDRTDGDNWDGLCPSCADQVSDLMDEGDPNCGIEPDTLDRNGALAHLRATN